jgi:hypothetical protein
MLVSLLLLTSLIGDPPAVDTPPAPPSEAAPPAPAAETPPPTPTEEKPAPPAPTTPPAATTPAAPVAPATATAPVPPAPASPAPNPDFSPPGEAPLSFADFSWMPGNAGAAERPVSFGPFTGEVRVDTAFHYDLSNPVDDTISGSSEAFRSGELQLTQLGVGGDFYYKGAMARMMTQFGMYSQTTPRNDPSPARGQWNLADAFRYISEGYGGYHFDVWDGINVQAGIFMSYIGLWSYYNFDNWTYQPSYVSSNTPWFFQGVRAQIFPNKYIKIEPWLINGWQSYGRFNTAPGFGGQVIVRPTDSLNFVFNNYMGTDTLNTPNRWRVHTDDSAMMKFYEDPKSFFSKAAGSLTVDLGCEFGDGTVHCTDQYFAGFMVYGRAWFWQDHIGATVGGGAITNPGRYLVLVPPINGATAFSGAAPFFTANKGDKFDAWDLQVSGDYSPIANVTFRVEYNHRAADVPYFAGHGGVTPLGGNQGAPGSVVTGFTPDLVPTEDRLTAALMVKL